MRRCDFFFSTERDVGRECARSSCFRATGNPGSLAAGDDIPGDRRWAFEDPAAAGDGDDFSQKGVLGDLADPGGGGGGSSSSSRAKSSQLKDEKSSSKPFSASWKSGNPNSGKSTPWASGKGSDTCRRCFFFVAVTVRVFSPVKKHWLGSAWAPVLSVLNTILQTWPCFGSPHRLHLYFFVSFRGCHISTRRVRITCILWTSRNSGFDTAAAGANSQTKSRRKEESEPLL
mmetsp:Transcript_19758/g.63542  ORF Transcript_19758/g.63542 Transcript_19758/m.63542 type:complete len:230 (-) Transcript_19758:42-731(-)